MVDVPGVLNFPTALDSATSLIASANLASTTLAAPYTAGASTLTVASNVLFPTSGLLTFPTSGLILSYTGKSGLTGFTGVARASTEPNNPADASVASLAAVEQRITSGSLNVLRQALLALEAKLGIGADTPTTGEFFQGTGAGSSGWSALTSGAVTTALGYTPQTPLGFTPPNYHSLVLVADDQAGADLGAKINAADAALGASAGTILVIQTGTISTAVTIAANHLLKFGVGTWSQSASISLNGHSSAIAGEGPGATVLNNTTLTGISITTTGDWSWVQLRDLSIARPTIATSAGGGHGVQFGANTMNYADIKNLHVTGHDIGMLLGSQTYGHVRHVRVATNARFGLFIANTVTDGVLQWQLDDILLELNGSHGGVVQAAGAFASGLSMGEWHRIRTYANTGFGLAILGTVGTPIQSFRLYDSFGGSNGNSGIYLDTYGTSHRIANNFQELNGIGLTGPTAATAATNVGRGIEVTANNTTVELIGNILTGNSYSGIGCSATQAVINDNVCINNGAALTAGERAGIRYIGSGGATITGNLCYSVGGGTSQIYGIYADNDVVIITGNSVQGSTGGIGMGAGPVVSTVFSNRYISGTAGTIPNIADGFTIADGKGIILGSTTGTKIGTATTQKLGFYNATPVIQSSGANQAAAPAGGTGATAGAYDTAAHRDALIALVNDMRTTLVNLGLMKGSA